MDEADRLLDLDFGTHIDELLKSVPTQRTTYLFSATMTTKVSKLQRASLTDPVRVETSSAYGIIPHKYMRSSLTTPQNAYRGLSTSVLCFSTPHLQGDCFGFPRQVSDSEFDDYICPDYIARPTV